MFAFSYSFTHSAVYVFSVHSKSVGFFLVTIAKAFAFAFGRASSSKFFSKIFWRNRKTISFSKTKRPGAFCYILLTYTYYPYITHIYTTTHVCILYTTNVSISRIYYILFAYTYIHISISHISLFHI